MRKYGITTKILTYMFLSCMVVVAVFPAIWMISTSVKDSTEQYDFPPEIIPDAPTFDNYINVFSSSKIGGAFINSSLVTFFVVLLTLFVSVLAAYGLTRYKFKGANFLRVFLLFGQMIPGVVLIIPLYFLIAKVGLIDSLFSLVLANLALTTPMGVIMLTAFFKTIPRELEEAAKIDGCSELFALFKIVLPAAKPGLIAVTIYTFIHTWEEFLFALNLSISAKSRTLPIAINMFAGEFAVDWGSTMAASTMVALPVLVIFLSCNKYFIKGLSDGAVKG